MSALTNAIEILRCFSSARPDLSFADVMALTGKPKSSTSRLLRSLRDCGLLEQDPHLTDRIGDRRPNRLERAVDPRSVGAREVARGIDLKRDTGEQRSEPVMQVAA